MQRAESINVNGKKENNNNNTGKDKNNWDAGMITPRLYVGSLRSATDLENLKIYNITHILTVAGKLYMDDDIYPSNISRLIIDIADHPASNILEILPQAIEYIEEALLLPCPIDTDTDTNTNLPSPYSNVLVHCASGISRSVSVCCGFLMIKYNYSYQDAITLIRQNRSLSSPNCGFRVQLDCLEHCKVKHSIPDAIQLYKNKLNVNEVMDITELIYQQREYANTIHQTVDNIENDFRTMLSKHKHTPNTNTNIAIEPTCTPITNSNTNTKEALINWQQQLNTIQCELDAYTDKWIDNANNSIGSGCNSNNNSNSNNNNHSLFVDMPSEMIRKSANTKATILLTDIETQLKLNSY